MRRLGGDTLIEVQMAVRLAELRTLACATAVEIERIVDRTGLLASVRSVSDALNKAASVAARKPIVLWPARRQDRRGIPL